MTEGENKDGECALVFLFISLHLSIHRSVVAVYIIWCPVAVGRLLSESE
jgi:hypothetical protein